MEEFMDTITLNKTELKDLMRETVKETLAEIIIDKTEILEIMEDRAFGKLMEEADNGEYVNEDNDI